MSLELKRKNTTNITPSKRFSNSFIKQGGKSLDFEPAYRDIGTSCRALCRAFDI